MDVLAPPHWGALLLLTLHGCRTGYCGMRCMGCGSCMGCEGWDSSMDEAGGCRR
jgi:hypothetical protein